ncbi:MAG: sugar transferase, partial [Bilifractor sp.]
VSGRSDIKDFDEVVRLDCQYIDNWSVGGDIKIIAKTVLQAFKKDNGAK